MLAALTYRVLTLYLCGFSLWVVAQNTRADTVPEGYSRIAREFAVPPSILYAVALTESGRTIESRHKGLLRPWPWTLNVAGKGLFFKTRQAAWAVLKRYLAQGRRSIDIGLMQVNWRYHARRLKDPYAALEPYYNLRVAVGILRDCHRKLDDWWAAVGCYHAPGADAKSRQRAQRYRARVRRHWQRLSEEGLSDHV